MSENSGTSQASTSENRSCSATRREWRLVAPVLLIVIGIILFVVVTLIVPGDVGRQMIADDGFVQILTFVVLISSVALAFVSANRYSTQRLNLRLTGVVLIAYAAREADLHKAPWLPEGFTNLRFYLADNVLIWEKVAFGVLMLGIVTTALLLVVRVLPKIQTDIAAKRIWLLMAVSWLVVFTASQISDRTYWNHYFLGTAFEETAEFVASGFVLLAVYYFPREESLSGRRSIGESSSNL